MILKCPRCGRPLQDGDDLLAEEPIADWNGQLVCAKCVWDSIPEQPPLPEEIVQRIMDNVLTRIHAEDN